MTLVSPRDRVDEVNEGAADAHPHFCPTCAHPAVSRTRLARAERAVLRLSGKRSGWACGAEQADIHEATAWGEPPCACADHFHR